MTSRPGKLVRQRIGWDAMSSAAVDVNSEIDLEDGYQLELQVEFAVMDVLTRKVTHRVHNLIRYELRQ